MDDGHGVVYSVKELLSRIEHKIDGLAAAVESKAPQSSLNQLVTRLERIEIELEELKASKAGVFAAVALCAVIGPLAITVILHYT